MSSIANGWVIDSPKLLIYIVTVGPVTLCSNP